MIQLQVKSRESIIVYIHIYTDQITSDPLIKGNKLPQYREKLYKRTRGKYYHD